MKKNHKANMTGARISADRPSVVIEDEGHIVSEIASSDLTTDKGVTVSFSVKQTGKCGNEMLKWIDWLKLHLCPSSNSPFPAFQQTIAPSRGQGGQKYKKRMKNVHLNCVLVILGYF